MLSTLENNLALQSASYARMVRRIFRGPGTLASVSSEREVLRPEETTATRLPVFLPGQLDRITGTTGHQSVQAEIASMLAPTYHHAATIAFHIKNAVVFDGSVYAGNLRHFIASKGLFNTKSETRHLKVAGLASSAVGHQYFGHWLRDDCIQYLLAEQTKAPICISGPVSDHKRRYASYFGQDWTPTDRAFVEELVIYQDFAQNQS